MTDPRRYADDNPFADRPYDPDNPFAGKQWAMPEAATSDASRQLPLSAGRKNRAAAREGNIAGLKGVASNAALGATLNLIDEVPGLGGIGDRARKFQETHPGFANLAQLAGGAAVPLPGVAAAYKALKPVTTGAKMAAGARIGGLAAGINAAGASEGDLGERLLAGAKAVPAGAVVGGAIPAIAPLVRGAKGVAKAAIRSPRKGLAVARTGYRALTNRPPYPSDLATLTSWRPPWIKNETPGQLLDDILPAQRAIDPNLDAGDFSPPRGERPTHAPGPRSTSGVTRQGEEALEESLLPPSRGGREPSGIGRPPQFDKPIRRQGDIDREIEEVLSRNVPEPSPLGRPDVDPVLDRGVRRGGTHLSELSDLGESPIPFPPVGSPTTGQGRAPTPRGPIAQAVVKQKGLQQTPQESVASTQHQAARVMASKLLKMPRTEWPQFLESMSDDVKRAVLAYLQNPKGL